MDKPRPVATERGWTLVRNIGNLANLSTPLGLVVALCSRARLRMVDGLLVADNARLPFIQASAMAIGSVVLVNGRTLEEAQLRIPALLEHENSHAWQYAYCLGLPFIPAYTVAMIWSQLSRGDRASANFFERQAGLASGGYQAQERRRRADRAS